MHHPTDRIIHTTAFVTPVVEQYLDCPDESRFVIILHKRATVLFLSGFFCWIVVGVVCLLLFLGFFYLC